MSKNIRLKKWTNENKILIFFIIVALCLFVSTLALAVSKNDDSCDLKKSKTQNIPYTIDRTDAESNKAKEINYRLPRSVTPMNYDLTLIPNMINQTFNGYVTITISVIKPTRTITLHTKKLLIGKVILKNIDNKNIPIHSKKDILDKREFFIITMNNAVGVGKYKLFFTYSGRLDHGSIGFYRSTLQNGE